MVVSAGWLFCNMVTKKMSPLNTISLWLCTRAIDWHYLFYLLSRNVYISCVSVWVCAYACACACACSCSCVRACVRTSVCMCVCVRVRKEYIFFNVTINFVYRISFACVISTSYFLCNFFCKQCRTHIQAMESESRQFSLIAFRSRSCIIKPLSKRYTPMILFHDIHWCSFLKKIMLYYLNIKFRHHLNLLFAKRTFVLLVISLMFTNHFSFLLFYSVFRRFYFFTLCRRVQRNTATLKLVWLCAKVAISACLLNFKSMHY